MKSIFFALCLVSLLLCSPPTYAGNKAYKHSPNCWLENASGYGITFFGTDPSISAIQTKMKELATTYQVPIEIIAAVAYDESGMHQFGTDGFVVHNITPECPTANATGKISSKGGNPPPGLGMMQLTSTTATSLAASLNRPVSDFITYWQVNLEAGVQLLSQKYSNAISGDKPCLVSLRNSSESRKILENWYYALKYYNSASNTATAPNGAPEYTAKIYDFIANASSYPEFAGLFSPVSVTLPSSQIPGFTNTQGFCVDSNGNWTNYQCNSFAGGSSSIHISKTFTTTTQFDLSLKSVSVPQKTYAPGAPIGFTTAVQNVGGRRSPGYWIIYYIRPDPS